MARRLLLRSGGLALALTACGDDGAGTAAGGGAGGASDTVTTTVQGPGPVAVSSGAGAGEPTSSGAGGANPDDPYGCLQGDAPPRPAAVPEGYRPWACWSQKPQCMLWIPEDPETMVDPITWEPCSEGSPGGEGCRQMARPWWPGQGQGIGATYPSVPELDTYSPGGPALLRFSKSSITGSASDDFIEWAVHDLDGPPRYALRRAVFSADTNCGFQDYDLTDGHWVMAPLGDDTLPIHETPHDGALLVDVASGTITLPYRDDQPQKASWKAGAQWLIRDTGAKLFLHDHAVQQELLIHDAATDTLGASASSVVQILDDAVLWEVATSSHLGIRAYDLARGSHDLIRYPADLTRGAGTPGTDGVDLVWMEGSGRAPGDLTYAVRSIMTSPFPTDPTALQPRRLRSDLSPMFGTNVDAFKVGCGRAAKSGGLSTKDVQIVRLSDGVGWYVEHTPYRWQSSRVVGLTCDEVFLVVQFWDGPVGQGSTIQRIRFDALGEGVPPD